MSANNGVENGTKDMSETTKNKLFLPVERTREESYGFKVTVVGTGAVGMAAVFSMLTQGVSNNIALIDTVEDKLKGEVMDLHHGANFLPNCKIEGSTDYSISAGSTVCIVTAGVRQKVGETRLQLVQRNTDILKQIVPQLVKYSPDAILIIASNPVDILTYVTWKLSGLPKSRVIGSGTNLDSARFHYVLSNRFGIAPRCCHGYIIGEHGDSSVPVWSGVNIAGVRLTDLNTSIGTDDDPEKWQDLHREVVNAGNDVIRLKGYTSWAIGLSLAQLANAIIADTNTVHPVSTYVKGIHKINDEVFLSLPCVIGRQGICEIIKQPLTDKERSMLHTSADIMAKVQAEINW